MNANPLAFLVVQSVKPQKLSLKRFVFDKCNEQLNKMVVMSWQLYSVDTQTGTLGRRNHNVPV